MIWALSYDVVNGVQELIESIDQYYLSNDMVGSKILPNDFDINIFPNPFNDQCIIKIGISRSVDEINIYSLDGNLVKTIGSKNFNDSKKTPQLIIKDLIMKSMDILISKLFNVLKRNPMVILNHIL